MLLHKDVEPCVHCGAGAPECLVRWLRSRTPSAAWSSIDSLATHPPSLLVEALDPAPPPSLAGRDLIDAIPLCHTSSPLLPHRVGAGLGLSTGRLQCRTGCKEIPPHGQLKTLHHHAVCKDCSDLNIEEGVTSTIPMSRDPGFRKVEGAGGLLGLTGLEGEIYPGSGPFMEGSAHAGMRTAGQARGFIWFCSAKLAHLAQSCVPAS